MDVQARVPTLTSEKSEKETLMLMTLLRRAAAFLAVPAIAAGAAAPADARPRGAPALWEVSDPDTKIYMFGTIHMLPKDYPWWTSTMQRAVASADTLVVETMIDPKNPAHLAAELRRLGYAEGLPPLASRVAPERRAMLEAAIAKTGLPRPVFDKMKTWAAAFTLLGVQFKELGLQSEAGVEEILRAAFTGAGKPIGQLETNGEQLGFFNDLSEKAQRDLLEGAIETPQSASGEFARMLRVWASGDVEGIAKTFADQMGGSPELMDALMKRRNANWTAWVQRRMATPGTVLLAVGAGHLAGPGSVQDLLKRGGYKVRRVQ